MDIILIHFIPNLILVSSLIVIWHILMNKKINFKDKRLYITIVSIMIISIFNYLLVNKFMKISIITLVFMFFFKYLFKCEIKRCIITPIFYQIIIMISEGLYILIIVTIFQLNVNELKDKFLGTYLIINLGTALFSIVIAKLPFVRKLYNSIINNVKRINNTYIFIFSIILIGIANILAMITYYKIDIRIIIILNIIFILLCSAIVFYSLKTKNKLNKVNDKYNIAINSLKDYEDMMSKYRIANHENKNLLLAIRAMIKNGEQNIPSYIDSIIKERYNDNEKLLLKVNKIPSGGLRATIYSEILKIKNHKINYELCIDKNVKTHKLINLDTNTTIDACKIIGAFIDNAIEEVEKLKESNILICLYCENEYLNIEVSNNYEQNIDVDKIYDFGYTTKGKEHGYGLSMVKNIIDNNSLFENQIKISKDVFTQILKIKNN